MISVSGWGRGGITIRAWTPTRELARLHPRPGVGPQYVHSLLSEDILTPRAACSPSQALAAGLGMQLCLSKAGGDQGQG